VNRGKGMREKGSTSRNPLEGLEELVSRCVKCGRCRSVCPVFQAVGREPSVARGKMALIEAALGNPMAFSSEELEGALSLCLLCGRCTQNCPNGAKAKEAVERARILLARDGGLPLFKRSVSKVASLDRKRRDPMVRSLAGLQKIILDHGGFQRGLLFKLTDSKWVPKIQTPFFLDRSRDSVTDGIGGRTVALFVGCSIHYLAPHVGEAALRLLEALGFRVRIPREQGCCGLVSKAMGDLARARSLAERFIETFGRDEWEAIVVPCASCAFHLSRGLVPLLEGTGLEHTARSISLKAVEMSSFLAEVGLQEILKAHPERERLGLVTYHDPCHMSVGLGKRKEPRALLEALSSYSYREMEGASLCCGMGGSFRIFHPRVSRTISRKKLSAIEESQADVIATTCMGCWLQLNEMVQKGHVRKSVVHLAELLWDELKQESK